jgi:hypothetical protein
MEKCHKVWPQPVTFSYSAIEFLKRTLIKTLEVPWCFKSSLRVNRNVSANFGRTIHRLAES